MRPSFMRSDVYRVSKHGRTGKPGKTPAQVGGVRPLSRMHPEHPARAMYGYPSRYIPECHNKQKFVP